MKKTFFALLLATSSLPAFSQAAAQGRADESSWLVQSGVLYRMGALCRGYIAADDFRVIGDVLLASSVDPFMTTMKASDNELAAILRGPSKERLQAVANENATYERIVSTIPLRQRMAQQECNPVLGQRAAEFTKKAQAAGVVTHSQRLANVMVAQKCLALGACAQ